MIKTINNIRMIMAMAVLSVVLFSCVREEMTCDKELIVVQRIGEAAMSTLVVRQSLRILI